MKNKNNKRHTIINLKVKIVSKSNSTLRNNCEDDREKDGYGYNDNKS